MRRTPTGIANMAGSRQIERAAAAWLARRDGGDWSPDDQAQLDAWLAQSTAHRVAWLRLRAAWNQSDRLKALAAGVAPGEVPARGAWSASPYTPRGEAQANGQDDRATAEPHDREEDASAVVAQASAAAPPTAVTTAPLGLTFTPRATPRRPRTARYAARPRSRWWPCACCGAGSATAWSSTAPTAPRSARSIRSGSPTVRARP
ncbi:FecR/PupR family sigma factor regulator [Lysobacter capsici]|uniref:FecR/PupR family sigma factor regulator n=1 Tax=Lysobacter capsici TaxID=435897 RepID=UPI00398D6092